MSATDVAVRLTANVAQYQKAMRDASASTDAVATSTTKTTSTVGSKWQTAGAGIASSMGLSYAAVAAAAGAAVAYSVKAASNLQESVNAVNVSYGESAEAVHKLGANAVESFGLSQRAFNEAAVGFSSFAEDIAASGDGDVAGTLEQLQLRATDLASVFNSSVPDAAEAMRSALSGEAEPMKRFGVVMTEAKVQAYALSTGIIEVGDKMTDAEKQTARYGFIMEETAKVQGDWANTSDGFAGSMKKAQANIEEMAASIGSVLIPALARGLTFINDTISGWQEIANLPAVQWTVNTVSDIPSTLDDFENAIWGWAGRVTGIGPQVTNTIDAATDSLNTHTGAVHYAGEATDEWVAKQLAAEAAVRAADQTTKDLSSSTYLVQEAIDAAVEALDRQTEAANTARDANMAMADGTYDLYDAEAALFDAIEAANTTLNDNEANLYDIRGALADVAISTDEMVTKQLELDGTTRDSVAGQELWTEKMLASAATLSGPMQNEVLAHIARVNGIPADKITWILADADPNNLAQVTREIDAIAAKPRTATISVKYGSLGSSDYTQPGFGTATARANGGPVRAGHLYEVGEGNAAEMLMMGGRQYLIPGNNGQVFAGGGVQGGRSSNLTINHYGKNLSTADVSRGFTLARLAQVA